MREHAPVPPKIRNLIKREIDKAMKPFGLARVEIEAGNDQDGDPVLLIEASYELSDRPVDPNALSELTTRLRNKLWELGEFRFPHIDHQFAEEQKVVGYR
jgi:hypothetical protein